jgi:Zn-finger nucleic acid-binding protein
MIRHFLNGVHVSICMGCGANFFDAGDLGAFEGWTEDIPDAADRAAAHRPSKVHCPACGATMEQIRFEMESPLEIERCSKCHGVLLDFEEIRRIPAVAKWAAAKRKARAG